MMMKRQNRGLNISLLWVIKLGRGSTRGNDGNNNNSAEAADSGLASLSCSHRYHQWIQGISTYQVNLIRKLKAQQQLMCHWKQRLLLHRIHHHRNLHRHQVYNQRHRHRHLIHLLDHLLHRQPIPRYGRACIGSWARSTIPRMVVAQVVKMNRLHFLMSWLTRNLLQRRAIIMTKVIQSLPHHTNGNTALEWRRVKRYSLSEKFVYQYLLT